MLKLCARRAGCIHTPSGTLGVSSTCTFSSYARRASSSEFISTDNPASILYLLHQLHLDCTAPNGLIFGTCLRPLCPPQSPRPTFSIPHTPHSPRHALRRLPPRLRQAPVYPIPYPPPRHPLHHHSPIEILAPPSALISRYLAQVRRGRLSHCSRAHQMFFR